MDDDDEDDDVISLIDDEIDLTGLVISGQSVQLIRGDTGADSQAMQWVLSKSYLQPLPGGKASDLVDRYDCRHLLDASSTTLLRLYKADKGRSPDDYLQDGDGDEEMSQDVIDRIQTERYIDLLMRKMAKETTVVNPQSVSSRLDDIREVPTAPFIHPSRAAQCEPAQELPAFVPSFPVPPVIAVVASTLAEQRLMEQTAGFVRKMGTQPEIWLKVKQAHNPSFGFLLHDNPLNAYYEHLKSSGARHREKSSLARIGDYSSDEEAGDGKASTTGKESGDRKTLVAESVTKSGGIGCQIERAKRMVRLQLGQPDSYLVPTGIERVVMGKMIRSIVKHGEEFQTRVRNCSASNGLFDFLDPSHALNPFYELAKSTALKRNSTSSLKPVIMLDRPPGISIDKQPGCDRPLQTIRTNSSPSQKQVLSISTSSAQAAASALKLRSPSPRQSVNPHRSASPADSITPHRSPSPRHSIISPKSPPPQQPIMPPASPSPGVSMISPRSPTPRPSVLPPQSPSMGLSINPPRSPAPGTIILSPPLPSLSRSRTPPSRRRRRSISRSRTRSRSRHRHLRHSPRPRRRRHRRPHSRSPSSRSRERNRDRSPDHRRRQRRSSSRSPRRHRRRY